MKLEQLPERQSYVHPEKEENMEVQVVRGEKLGQGSYGIIYEAQVTRGNHTLPMAVKVFTNEDAAANNCTIAINSYKLLKESGLKVWPTYRAREDKAEILMTLGHAEPWVCVGPTNEEMGSIELHGHERLPKIANFRELTEEVFKEALLAAEKGICFNPDVLFYFINTETNVVEHVFGDYDEVYDFGHEDGYAYADNLLSVADSLHRLIEKNVVEEQQGTHLRELLEIGKQCEEASTQKYEVSNRGVFEEWEQLEQKSDDHSN